MNRAEQEIIHVVQTGATQMTVARLYGAALDDAGVDWAAVNGVILGRWKVSGLNGIKHQAWKLAQR